MALVLAFDTETTGLNTRTDYIIEVGAAIYDTTIKQVVDVFSQFVLWPARPVITQEITDITHITAEMVEKWGSSPDEVFPCLLHMAQKCDYICAHNALGFDRPILESNVLRIHDPSDYLKKRLYALKWIDTLIDIPYPSSLKVRTLKYNAFEHGYIMYGAHRALNDVLAMLHVLSCYDFAQVEAIASTPFETIFAKVDYADRDKAKKAGFTWNADLKKWEKKQRKYFTDKIASQLSFGIELSQ